MNATNDNESEEQSENCYTKDQILRSEDLDDTEMGEMLPFAEYELEIGRTVATDERTGEQYTLWRAEGRPVGTSVDGITEVSPNLPEAVMGVCETLQRTHGDL